MKLRDLDAQFVDSVTAKSRRRLDGVTLVGAQGIHFQCPACGAGKPVEDDDEHPGRRYIVGAHYIDVLFANPRGVDVAPADAGPTDSNGAHPRWTIAAGSTLDDLSLTPSIDCSRPYKDAQGVSHESTCRFHGYITNGDVV